MASADIHSTQEMDDVAVVCTDAKNVGTGTLLRTFGILPWICCILQLPYNFLALALCAALPAGLLLAKPHPRKGRCGYCEPPFGALHAVVQPCGGVVLAHAPPSQLTYPNKQALPCALLSNSRGVECLIRPALPPCCRWITLLSSASLAALAVAGGPLPGVMSTMLGRCGRCMHHLCHVVPSICFQRCLFTCPWSLVSASDSRVTTPQQAAPTALCRLSPGQGLA
jgi:hypothetical protein